MDEGRSILIPTALVWTDIDAWLKLNYKEETIYSSNIHEIKQQMKKCKAMEEGERGIDLFVLEEKT